MHYIRGDLLLYSKIQTSSLFLSQSSNTFSFATSHLLLVLSIIMKGTTIASFAVILWSTAVVALPRPGHTRRDADHQIGFDVNIIFPHHTDYLPLFSLGNAAQFPVEKFNDILKVAAPGARLTELATPHGSLIEKRLVDVGRSFFYDGDRLAGYTDSTTGETSVFPKLGSLTAGTHFDTSGITQIAANTTIIPVDHTQHSIITGSTLSGSQKTVGGTASPPATYLLESIIQRQVTYENQLHPVCGPGTKASFSFGSDGTVKAFTHLWRTATSKASTITPLSQDSIQQHIAAQISGANLNANVTVKGVELCFYDSGNQYIQPVYRFNATVSHPFGLSDSLIVGYIPAGGTAQEPLPSLNSPANQAMPTTTTNNNSTSTNSTTTKRQEAGITVGRYAMRGDQYSPQIVVDENAFWNGLSSVSNDFVNSQYYWDEPFIYESDAQYYVDAVNVAFTEGHGNVHYFTTDETLPNWGGVQIAGDLPANGYGPGAGGSLAYWFIRSCDVVSTPIDYPAADYDDAFAPWWQVFNGMHAVLGYRTEAQVYDNEMGNVGKALGMGQSVVHGWMSAALGGGKTSAVTVCGHDDDTIFDIGNIGKPGCLQIWWYS